MVNGNRGKPDEGSDDEFEHVRAPRQEEENDVEEKPEDILAYIVSENLDFGKPETAAVREFHNKYRETFLRQEERKTIPEPGNILHVLATHSSPSGDYSEHWNETKLTHFLRWILQHHSAFLEASTQGQKRFPLHTAMLHNNEAFVRAVVEFDSLKNIKTVLVQKKSNRNYIQLAVIAHSPLVPLIAQKCAELTLPVWNGSKIAGKESETPLHIAVRKIYRPHPKGSLAVKLVAQPGTASYSPISEIYKQWKVMCRLEKQQREAQLMEGHLGAPIARVEETHRNTASYTSASDALVPDHDVVSRRNVASLLLSLINDYQESRKPLSQVDIVKLFIRLSQSSLESQSREVDEKTQVEVRETPYQERIAKLGEAWYELVDALKQDRVDLAEDDDVSDEEAVRMVVIDDPVADTIRYHCLRHFDRDKIARCLYQPGNERHIDFDLAGLRSPAISNAFLKRLAKHLRFESILMYVALPKLALEKHATEIEDQSQDKRNRQISGEQDSLDLRDVFRWLRQNNVKRILKVTVVDYGSPCHSDANIEEALGGFQVEIWDWKKVDICTDVIWNSTKNARHVSLYSSCNNAVLMGWASSDGLGDREKFAELEHVRLFIAKGQESDRRARYIEQFESKIRALRIPNSDNKNVTVEHHLDDGKVSYAADFKNNEITEQQEVEWISQVKAFSQFMGSIPRKEKEKITPIKIAIIDDGVDASLEFIVGQIAGGKSFCPYASSSDLMNAYYVPSGQHGTMMADLICQICPSCRLYVARLDERPSRSDSSRQITIESAAEAVKWAVDCRVDVISMSWTIEATSADSKELSMLEKAIAEAKKNNILMFCSTSDHGSIATENCYPGKWGECIRVGAATEFGDKCTWVPDQYEYLLPGKNIPFKWKRRDGISSWYESGSSLATALAAGLSGLLLYCDRAVNGNDSRSLQSKTRMKDLFHSMAVTSKDHKFLRADVWFDRKFRGYVQDKYTESGSAKALTQPAGVITGQHGPRNTLKPLRETPWSTESREALKKLLEEMKTGF